MKAVYSHTVTRDIDITENRVADLGEGSWGPEHPPPPTYFGKKRRNHRRRKSRRASKTKPPPPPLALDPPLE